MSIGLYNQNNVSGDEMQATCFFDQALLYIMYSLILSLLEKIS